jgi:acetylornithine deacetylase/succinyl-diaminopimelate desuccinylase-like protein
LRDVAITSEGSPESTVTVPSRLLSDAGSLIRIRSANPPGQERPVAEWLAGRLEGIADSVSVETIAEDRANMLATFEFGPGPTFLLCSHSDVVPVQDEGQWDPVVRDGRLIGRGACDAKGAIAAMIEACERLAERRGELRGTLILACVADEESDAEGALALVSRGLRADAAIIGEPTSNIAVLSSRGAVRLAVRFHGRAAHASSPSQGVNAIYGAARFILAMESLDAELIARGSMGSCAATIVDGGSKLNVVPEACTVQVDRRLGPSETSAAAVGEIESRLSRVAEEAPGLSYELSRAGITVEAFGLGADFEFATRLLSALGQPSPGPIFRAVSDAPHLIAAGIPTAILGPGSLDTAHSSSELVEVQDLEVAAALYERAVRAYLGLAHGTPVVSTGR